MRETKQARMTLQSGKWLRLQITYPSLKLKMRVGLLERNTETIRNNEKDVNQLRQYNLAIR